MKNCKVLTGPISLDRIYYEGEEIFLDNETAEQFVAYGFVEILPAKKKKPEEDK